MDPDRDAARAGISYALLAYASWGLAPAFWKQLGAVAPAELLLHRVVWSALFLLGLMAWRGRLAELGATARAPDTARWFLLSAALIGSNWFVYLYAVSTARIVEASLGYFINPLVSVALGAFVLGEHLRRAQAIAVGLAALGVAALAWIAGGVPWIALFLAADFATYGLVRKRSPSDALLGSTLEAAALAGPAALGLAAMAAEGGGALGHVSPALHGGLLATGLMTALPLLWFSEAARRLPLSTLAFLQYLAPTGQLLLGVAVYGEPFGGWRAAAFGLIWAACAVFTWDLVRARR